MVEIQIDSGPLWTVTFVVDDLPVTKIKEYTLLGEVTPTAKDILDHFLEAYGRGTYSGHNDKECYHGFEVNTVTARKFYEDLSSAGFTPLIK